MKRKSTRAQKIEDDRRIKEMVRRVNDEEAAFVRRWPTSSLALVDQQLYVKLNEQLGWFRESAIVHPNYERIIDEGEATIRGFQAATELMSQKGAAVVAWSPDLGGHLVISHAIDDPADLTLIEGKDIVVTPAEIISWLLSYPDILALKREFQGGVMQFTHTDDADGEGSAQVDVQIDHHGELVVDTKVL